MGCLAPPRSAQQLSKKKRDTCVHNSYAADRATLVTAASSLAIIQCMTRESREERMARERTEPQATDTNTPYSNTYFNGVGVQRNNLASPDAGMVDRVRLNT